MEEHLNFKNPYWFPSLFPVLEVISAIDCPNT
jgi:hypothetical protein